MNAAPTEEQHDDELRRFEAEGSLCLPPADDSGYVENEGAKIWYAAYGAGAPVILLHGGLGHSGNWGHQVPDLLAHKYRVVLIDSRGHGRSTHDTRPYSYELMASDVLAVMHSLQLTKVSLVGWSDGACTALILASKAPERVSGVFFFACNMDPSGVKPFEATSVINRCFSRHTKDYAELSPASEEFREFVEAVGLMERTQPNFTKANLAAIHVPVVIVQSEYDEFIKPDHAEYLSRSIPNAEYVFLAGVSHFAPLQRPKYFNDAMLTFLEKINSHK